MHLPYLDHFLLVLSQLPMCSVHPALICCLHIDNSTISTQFVTIPCFIGYSEHSPCSEVSHPKGTGNKSQACIQVVEILGAVSRMRWEAGKRALAEAFVLYQWAGISKDPSQLSLSQELSPKASWGFSIPFTTIQILSISLYIKFLAHFNYLLISPRITLAWMGAKEYFFLSLRWKKKNWFKLCNLLTFN